MDDENATAVCWRCAEDEHLKRIIRSEGQRRKCSLCGKCNRKAYAVGELAQLMEPIIRGCFGHGQDVKQFGPDDEEWWEQEGDELSWVVQEVLGQQLDFEDELIDALVDSEHYWPPDGDVQFFDTSQHFVQRRFVPYGYHQQWHNVVEDLKFQRRYFCESARQLFEDLFAGVDELHAWSDHDATVVPVVRSLPIGLELFRARLLTSRAELQQVLSNPAQQLGPPPRARARAGRMNADGVVVFYGALESETALAEMRPPLGGELAVGCFTTRVSVRLLDLRRLTGVRPGTGLSYFQRDFAQQMERTAFLRQLHNLIAQPIVPGHEAEYLITQTLAEYLAHVHDPRFDGLLFGSVQREGGTNVVLFAQAPADVLMHYDEPTFPIDYVPDGQKVFKTKAIAYEHRDLDVFQHDGEFHLHDLMPDWEDEW